MERSEERGASVETKASSGGRTGTVRQKVACLLIKLRRVPSENKVGGGSVGRVEGEGEKRE